MAKRARARPVISTAAPVVGAYQSGESIAASGGICPERASDTAAPRFTRPQPKCEVHWSIEGRFGLAARSGEPTPATLPAIPVAPPVTRSAVCSRISRVSSGRSAIGGVASSAEEITSAAAPAALPVFSEPVVPSIEIELLPPYWVVLAPRK